MSQNADAERRNPRPGLGARVGDGSDVHRWAPAQRRSGAVVLDDDQTSDGASGRRLFQASRPDASGRALLVRDLQGLRPDPASRFQPDGVFGPSMIVDPDAFPGTTPGVGRRHRHRQVVYEMHIGTFTPAARGPRRRKRLPALAELGITTLEIMPIAEFAGRFGWGLRRRVSVRPITATARPTMRELFVDDAHAHRPRGDSRCRLQPSRTRSAMSSAISASVLRRARDRLGPRVQPRWPHSGPVRQFMRANVRHWMDEYHFDGLRFDATHAIVDRSPEHIVDELTRYAREAARGR